MGWILAFISIMGSAFVVFVLAVEFGNSKTYHFLTSMVVTFVASVFITYPVYASTFQ